MGKGFVSLAAPSDFVTDVGINRVFTFENEKKQYHLDQALKNKEQNKELEQRYQQQVKQMRDNENLIAEKHVSDQHQHFDNKKEERKRFLKKISSLNEKIVEHSKSGVFNQIHTI